ncbi:MAG: glycosyltransferase [Bacteroidales bacterium]|nr:glycosyltransferase [Bacteroidales bacterium]
MYYPAYYIEVIRYGLTTLFGLSLFIQLYYYFRFYFQVPLKRRTPQLIKYPISVIVCARNEAENLEKNLPTILNQAHENFEVIVVNDCSTDNTDNVLAELMLKYKNLRTTTITPDKKFTHGKKLAVTVGVKAAKNEWLVFTDADCAAGSDQWLNRLQENFTDSTDIVLGYGGYKRRRGLLNRYIRFDTAFIAIQYLGFALAGKPYMGVGRNLVYRKSLFFKNKGFASHYNLISGDDDLFVNETANKRNTAVEFHPESHTRSEPKITWGQWFGQKKRHVSTASRYKPKHYFLIGLEPLSRLLFYLTFCYLLCMNLFHPYILIAGGVRFLFQVIILSIGFYKLRERKLFVWMIIFDFISIFINCCIYLSTAIRSKKSRWK